MKENIKLYMDTAILVASIIGLMLLFLSVPIGIGMLCLYCFGPITGQIIGSFVLLLVSLVVGFFGLANVAASLD